MEKVGQKPHMTPKPSLLKGIVTIVKKKFLLSFDFIQFKYVFKARRIFNLTLLKILNNELDSLK